MRAFEVNACQDEPAIVALKRAIAFASINKHWYIQHPSISEWIGRQKELQKMRKALLDPESDVDFPEQKRFVIHGISGSGKTQLACKFAQDYRAL